MQQCLLDFLTSASPCELGHYHMVTTRGRDNLLHAELVPNCSDVIAACRVVANRNGHTKHYTSRENALRYQVDTDDINGDGVIFTDYRVNEHDPEWWVVEKVFFAPPLTDALLLMVQAELKREEYSLY
jgi:hypothetical protein